MKKKRFPKEVSRFFNPLKSLVIPFDERRKHVNMKQKMTHQREKSKERSYIPVYYGGGTATAYIDKNGVKKYR